ncbi:unnamed protein product [Calicophoron daubneyi]|uniref:Activating signal cointegrator 1 complex subunit 1 n=1 Tax=Calicophoron daubneyi TaxID=300641 RepID=A0AAV2T5E8_CALDB
MASVLSPEIIHLGNRHYRKNPSRYALQRDNLSLPVGRLESSDNEESMVCNLEDSPVVVEPDGMNFKAVMDIPWIFHRFIVGTQHNKLKSLEREFGCEILIPPSSAHASTITVKSSAANNIINACRRLSWIQSTSRARLRPTHFISLPANLPTIQKSFESFRNTALELASEDKTGDFAGVDASIFIHPSRLHFTIIPLVLAGGEVEMACRVLKDYLSTPEAKGIFAGGPLRLTIRGLEYMNDDPQAIHVLYGKVSPIPDANRLQKMANALANLFYKHSLSAGEMFRPDGNVKLHMTLMNSLFRVKSSDDEGSEEIRQPFSAVGILKELNDFCFCENQSFDCLHLSIMGEKSDGFYPNSCVIQLYGSGSSLAPLQVIMPSSE